MVVDRDVEPAPADCARASAPIAGNAVAGLADPPGRLRVDVDELARTRAVGHDGRARLEPTSADPLRERAPPGRVPDPTVLDGDFSTLQVRIVRIARCTP
jgi:hypothetical protein